MGGYLRIKIWNYRKVKSYEKKSFEKTSNANLNFVDSKPKFVSLFIILKKKNLKVRVVCDIQKKSLAVFYASKNAVDYNKTGKTHSPTPAGITIFKNHSAAITLGPARSRSPGKRFSKLQKNPDGAQMDRSDF